LIDEEKNSLSPSLRKRETGKGVARYVKLAYTLETFVGELRGEVEKMKRLVNDKKPFLIFTAIIILGFALAAICVVYPFLLNQDPNDSIHLAWSRVILSAITIPIILGGFYYSTIQFRKAMAKPKIKVAFNEKGEQQITLTWQKNISEPPVIPTPILINEGNAVARYFQVDFIIPDNIGIAGSWGVNFVYAYKEKNFIFSNFNEGRYTLFVNRPYSDQYMFISRAVDMKKAFISYPDNFEIHYKIYGDWAETQEGTLKVNVIKQQEVPHAHS
jgi:hypothetical protein